MMEHTFTDRVKKLLQLAQSEAIRLGTDYVGTEHLLLGLIKERDGVACAVLNKLNVNLTDMIAALEKMITAGSPPNCLGMLPLTPRAKKILEMSASESRGMSHKMIGTEHVLLSLIRDTDSNASGVLTAAGLSYDGIKKEIANVMSGIPSSFPPEVPTSPSKDLVDWFDVDSYSLQEINPKLQARGCTARDVISIVKTEAGGYLIFFKNKHL